MQLFLSQEDDDMITMTGFSYSSFIQLLECFTPYYESYNPIVGSGENIRRFTPREDGNILSVTLMQKSKCHLMMTFAFSLT